MIDFYRRIVRPEATDGALSVRVAAGDGALGAVRVRRGGLRAAQARLADRGRQPLRLVLLRLDPRRVHPRDPDEARDGERRLLGHIAGMAAVLYVYNWVPWIAFLWHNLIGAVVVVVVGMAISYTQPAPSPR